MIKRLVCTTSATCVARCIKWSRFGRGSMTKVGQDSGKEQKGRTRRGGWSDETRFARDESVSSRIQGRENCVERDNGERGRRTFPYRKCNGGHFSRRGRPFPVHDHHEIQTKMANSGWRWGRDEQEVREIRNERGKWERRKSSAERQRGPRRGKRTTGLTTHDGGPCRPMGFPFSIFFFPSFFPPLPFPFSLLCPCYTCRILFDHTISLRFFLTLKSFLCSFKRDRIFMILRCVLISYRFLYTYTFITQLFGWIIL